MPTDRWSGRQVNMSGTPGEEMGSRPDGQCQYQSTPTFLILQSACHLHVEGSLAQADCLLHAALVRSLL